MATTLLGRTSAGASTDFNVQIAGWKFTAAASGTLATLKCQTQVANAESTILRLALYDDSAGGSRPGALLTQGSTTSGITGTGVMSVDVSADAVSISSGTVYWIGWWGSTHWDFKGDSAGSYVECTSLQQTFPATWPTGNGSGSINAILWGEDSGGGGGATVKLLGTTGVGT